MLLLDRIRSGRTLQRQDIEPPLHDPLALTEKSVSSQIDAVAFVVEGLGDTADGIGRLADNRADIRTLEKLVGSREPRGTGTGNNGNPRHARTLLKPDPGT